MERFSKASILPMADQNPPDCFEPQNSFRGIAPHSGVYRYDSDSSNLCIHAFAAFCRLSSFRLGAGLTGAVVFACVPWLLMAFSHCLGQNWFQTLELREEHQLITSGAFKYVRHPIMNRTGRIIPRLNFGRLMDVD
jgi:hypothetical protein